MSNNCPDDISYVPAECDTTVPQEPVVSCVPYESPETLLCDVGESFPAPPVPLPTLSLEWQPAAVDSDTVLVSTLVPGGAVSPFVLSAAWLGANNGLNFSFVAGTGVATIDAGTAEAGEHFATIRGTVVDAEARSLTADLPVRVVIAEPLPEMQLLAFSFAIEDASLWGLQSYTVFNPENFRPHLVDGDEALVNRTDASTLGGYRDYGNTIDLGVHDYEVSAQLDFAAFTAGNPLGQFALALGLECGNTVSTSANVHDRVVSFWGGVTVEVSRKPDGVGDIHHRLIIAGTQNFNDLISARQTVALPPSMHIATGDAVSINLRVRRVAGLFSVWLNDDLYIEDFDPLDYRAGGYGSYGEPGGTPDRRRIGAVVQYMDLASGWVADGLKISNIRAIVLGEGQSF